MSKNEQTHFKNLAEFALTEFASRFLKLVWNFETFFIKGLKQLTQLTFTS